MFEDGSGIYRKADKSGYTSNVFGQKLNSDSLTNATAVDGNYAGGISNPFNFTDAAGLQKAADNTVAGNMNDCGECHVGGGAMEYVPNYGAAKMLSSAANPAAREPLRPGLAAVPGSHAASFDFTGLVTAFNYLIDIFGPKGDGVGATLAAKQVDYSKTGVLEMDCLICHLKDYSWEERKHAVRTLNFDASRVTGAGFGHYSSATDGTVTTPTRNVTYDMSKFVAVDAENPAAGIKMAPAVAASILGKPDSGNCASCHAATDKEKFQVEWKKRGDFWGGSEVHGGIGCMGCHERNDLTATGDIDTAKVGTSGIANSSNKKLAMCDPAKGGDCDYDAQWNAMDKVAFKSCAYCHSGPTADEVTSGNGNGLRYGAPNADAAHAAAGLLAKIVQKQYDSTGALVAANNGVPTASHIDLLDCTVCHTTKQGITGGAVVDGTGADAEGRLATHDTVKVERDMEGNLVPYWKGGKLFVGNLLTSFFWRDQAGSVDANNDTRKGGLDPLFPTHVTMMNKANGNKKAMLEDGAVTAAELTGMINYYNANIAAITGNAGTYDVKLSALGVPFKATHNIGPSENSLGRSCTDCHSATGDIFAKTIQILPKSSMKYNSGQIVTYTKVNGSTQGTDIHPSVFSKSGVRSVALPMYVTPTAAPPGQSVQVAGTEVDLANLPVTKANLIYENAFTNRDLTWKTSAAPIVGSAALSYGSSGTVGAGSVLKIQVKGTPVAEYTDVVPTPAPANTADLLTDMGAFATDANSFGFTVTATSDVLTITATGTKEIRLSPQTDVGAFSLTGALWVTETIKGVLGNVETSARSTWLAYMKNDAVINAAACGIGIDPVASIGAIADVDPVKLGTQVVVNTAIPVTATANAAGFVTYAWSASDATITPDANKRDASISFTGTGSKTITLTVTDEEGKVRTTSATVDVLATAPMGIVWTDTVGSLAGSLAINNLPAGTNKVKVVWGDGTSTTKTSNLTAAVHTYASAGNKLVKVYAYNGTVQIGYMQAYIAVLSTN